MMTGAAAIRARPVLPHWNVKRMKNVQQSPADALSNNYFADKKVQTKSKITTALEVEGCLIYGCGWVAKLTTPKLAFSEFSQLSICHGCCIVLWLFIFMQHGQLMAVIAFISLGGGAAPQTSGVATVEMATNVKSII